MNSYGLAARYIPNQLRFSAIIDISHFSAGWHEIRFDGKDRSGRDLPAGIYLVQMQIENQIANTLRINLVR